MRDGAEKARMPAAAPYLDDCTAMALPMTGQRCAYSCSLDMVPPQGEARGLGRVAVDMARRVAGEADLRNGHMALD